MIFPQFIAALSEWVDAKSISLHRQLVRDLYVRGFTVEDAGDFLCIYTRANFSAT